ncbi:MAG: flavin reductase family protein [Cyanobacteria bacterium REEB67]|nr:flavin reductase family protein [Cyanobacteria bacterium REEB67]
MTSATTTSELKARIGPALGRVPSGVFIVTVLHSGKKDGMMASWIAQAGFEPPSIVVAVNKSRPIMEALKVGDRFGVNVLSKRNMDIFKSFAKPHHDADTDAKFEGIALLDKVSDAPVFQEAVSYMVATVKSVTDASDHVLVVGEIVDGELLNGGDEPMVHLRKDGFQY